MAEPSIAMGERTQMIKAALSAQPVASPLALRSLSEVGAAPRCDRKLLR
jgi:hypothetical protein